MNIPFFKKGPIKVKPEFIKAFTNKNILRDESQSPLSIKPRPYFCITDGITDDHPLLKVGNRKFGNKKQSKQINK